ncbi:hypothetical protein HFD88_005555 [Aspergillus terreus]|nr:hypothetical protein HFD88_005555 [Aspergillus terreus]
MLEKRQGEKVPPVSQPTLLPKDLDGSRGDTRSRSQERSLESLETSLPLRTLWSSPDRGGHPVAFKKQRFPPATKKLYLPILPGTGGLTLALATAHKYPVSFFKTYPLEALQIQPDQIVKTSHENLVNLEEAYLGHKSVVLTYDSYGISLEEIRRASNIFAGDEGAVATICRELLKGLNYIHNEIGVTHGNLSCHTVVLTEKGEVKIADIGVGMVRGYGAEDGYWDVRAVRQIAAVLLDLKPGAEPAGGLRLDAYNFVYRSSNVTANELLNHRFLEGGIEPWCLQSLAILSKIMQYNA